MMMARFSMTSELVDPVYKYATIIFSYKSSKVMLSDKLNKSILQNLNNCLYWKGNATNYNNNEANMTHPLIKKYNLEPHPEGGFYRQVFRSDNETSSYVHNQMRPALTHIYFLLLKGQVSRFHRVLHDEVWNHYEGAPLQLFQLENQQVGERRIGGENNEYVEVVKAGNFQAAATMGEYSLVGCSVAPGFDFNDFSFIEEPSMKEWIKVAHPDLTKFI
ncbi:hypothetical protein KUL118_32680 [Tenacibaculum sp. KUL118]|nr:hypothetical protein KUL118_32680 [Tenacibaculum sp. KUL118]